MEIDFMETGFILEGEIDVKGQPEPPHLVYLAREAPKFSKTKQESFHLNDDVVCEVLSYLEPSDLTAFALSCKAVFQVARERLRDHLYSRIYRKARLSSHQTQIWQGQWQDGGYTYSPGHWMLLIRDDPLIAQHIKKLHICYDEYTKDSWELGKASPDNQSDHGLVDKSDEKSTVFEVPPMEQDAIQHFVDHSRFLSDKDKNTWSKNLLTTKDLSSLHCSLLFCSLLPALNGICVTGTDTVTGLAPLQRLISAVHERQEQQTLLNASDCLLQRRHISMHQIRSIEILSERPDNFPPLLYRTSSANGEDQTILLQDLVPLCLIRTVTKLKVDSVRSGYEWNIFKWPADYLKESSLKEVVFPNSEIFPVDAYTFVSGLPKIRLLQLSTMRNQIYDGGWKLDFYFEDIDAGGTVKRYDWLACTPFSVDLSFDENENDEGENENDEGENENDEGENENDEGGNDEDDDEDDDDDDD